MPSPFFGNFQLFHIVNNANNLHQIIFVNVVQRDGQFTNFDVNLNFPPIFDVKIHIKSWYSIQSWNKGAIQIIRDTFLPILEPPPPCVIWWHWHAPGHYGDVTFLLNKIIPAFKGLSVEIKSFMSNFSQIKKWNWTFWSPEKATTKTFFSVWNINWIKNTSNCFQFIFYPEIASEFLNLDSPALLS